MSNNKYLTVFTVAWQNEFTYRINFLFWRLRNVLRFLMTFFLWSGIFTVNKTAFGYTQPQILTYIFMVLVVNSIVLSSRASEEVGAEIASGNLSNYLVRPISYIKYWFMRDLSNKLLNLILAIIEIVVLFLILKPAIAVPNFLTSLEFIIACILAALLYFFFNISVRFIAFWVPESTWPFVFLTFVLYETLAGSIFPLNVLPQNLFNLLQFTPFPYLLFYPISIFTGRIVGFEVLLVLIKSIIWIFLMYILSQVLWKKGLKVYGAEGR